MIQQEAPDATGAHIDPARVERLRRVGIIDALRIQGWSEDGLTIPQMRLLWALRDENGLPVGVLAEHLGVNPSTITGHVDRLVRQGLVRRVEDPADRRIVRNYLTDEGDATVGALRRIAGTFIVNILRRLDDTQLGRLEAAGRPQSRGGSGAAGVGSRGVQAASGGSAAQPPEKRRCPPLRWRTPTPPQHHPAG